MHTSNETVPATETPSIADNASDPAIETAPEASEPVAAAEVSEVDQLRKEKDRAERAAMRLRRDLASTRAAANAEMDVYRNHLTQTQNRQQQTQSTEQDAPLTRAELERELSRRTAEQFEQARSERIGKKIEAAAKADKEFADALDSADVEFSREQQSILRETLDDSEHATDLAKYLAKHPDEAERLAEYAPVKFARELGRLEDKVKELAKTKISTAPKPIDPVRPNSTVNKDPKDMTDSEFAKWRREQIKRRGQG